jgi:hypothetical protein
MSKPPLPPLARVDEEALQAEVAIGRARVMAAYQSLGRLVQEHGLLEVSWAWDKPGTDAVRASLAEIEAEHGAQEVRVAWSAIVSAREGSL